MEYMEKYVPSELAAKAIEAAKEAGKIIMEVYKTDFSFSRKSDKSHVTKADMQSSEYIISELSKTGIPVLSEEGKSHDIKPKNGMIWIVDPLDGTSDFVDKTGEFSVSIGLARNGIPILGVIFVPITGALYVAEKGKGAFKFHNNKTTKLKTRSNEKPLVLLSRHHMNEKESGLVKALDMDYEQKGSCAIKIMRVCEGSANASFFIASSVKVWDTCASTCIINEAGGIITDMNGNPLKYDLESISHNDGILAADASIHGIIVKKYTEMYA